MKALVIPDSGFAEEVFPIVEEFGEDNILLLRIHRKGCDFSRDSRSYLHNMVKNEVDIHNDFVVETFHHELHEIVGNFLAS